MMSLRVYTCIYCIVLSKIASRVLQYAASSHVIWLSSVVVNDVTRPVLGNLCQTCFFCIFRCPNLVFFLIISVIIVHFYCMIELFDFSSHIDLI